MSVVTDWSLVCFFPPYSCMSVLDSTAHLIPNLITTVLLMPFAFACVRREGGREGVDNQMVPPANQQLI